MHASRQDENTTIKQVTNDTRTSELKNERHDDRRDCVFVPWCNEVCIDTFGDKLTNSTSRDEDEHGGNKI